VDVVRFLEGSTPPVADVAGMEDWSPLEGAVGVTPDDVGNAAVGLGGPGRRCEKMDGCVTVGGNGKGDELAEVALVADRRLARELRKKWGHIQSGDSLRRIGRICP